MTPIDYWLIGLGSIAFWMLAFKYVRFHSWRDVYGQRVWSMSIFKLLLIIGRLP